MKKDEIKQMFAMLGVAASLDGGAVSTPAAEVTEKQVLDKLDVMIIDWMKESGNAL